MILSGFGTGRTSSHSVRSPISQRAVIGFLVAIAKIDSSFADIHLDKIDELHLWTQATTSQLQKKDFQARVCHVQMTNSRSGKPDKGKVELQTPEQ